MGSILVSVAQAATTVINITGAVIAKPQCVINNNQAIFVDFGNDLLTTKVNGTNYIRNVDYDLDCKNNSTNTMRMRVLGNVASFNSNAIQSSKSNLAIALMADGKPLNIDSWVNFTYPNKPVLQAVPIKGSGTLTSGFFRAGATLMVDYQ
ncbi:fimbrial protein [Serratia marcescens]|nr:fimbrial protein [Serratia marcescens]